MQTAIVRHILVKDKDLAEQLKKKLQNGADFAKIAKQYSTCNSAKRGGELGEVKKGQLVPVIDKVVFCTFWKFSSSRYDGFPNRLYHLKAFCLNFVF